MKKRAMTLGLALFCAFLLCGCQRTTPAAPAQEAAPEPEAAEETVLAEPFHRIALTAVPFTASAPMLSGVGSGLASRTSTRRTMPGASP